MSRELALKSDTLWLRDIAVAATKESEVIVETTSGSVVKGFLTGLDELWLQMTTLEDRQRTLISLQNITSVMFTKRTIDSIGLNETQKKAVKGFSISFRKTAEEYLEAENADTEGRD